MNLIIILPQECTSDTRAVVSGSRADELILRHGLTDGLRLRVGVLGGLRGSGVVERCHSGELVISLQLTEMPPCREAVALIVAVPRPQTVKKVIHLAVTLGVQSLHFFAAANTVKSYLQSKTLLPEAVERETILGLEQCQDTLPPIIKIHRSYKQFISYELPGMLREHRESALFFADTVPSLTASPEVLGRGTFAFAAIGPELGWEDSERENLLALGFKAVSLGPRILRVETATAIVLGQLMLASRVCV